MKFTIQHFSNLTVSSLWGLVLTLLYFQACPDLIANVRQYPADSDAAKIRDRGVVAQIFLDLR